MALFKLITRFDFMVIYKIENRKYFTNVKLPS